MISWFLILIILYPYIHEAAEYIQWSSGSQVVVTPVVFTCQVRISISGLLLVACMHYPVSHLWFSHTAYNNFFQQLYKTHQNSCTGPLPKHRHLRDMKSRTARTGEAAPHGLSLQSKMLAWVATVAARLSTQWQSGKQTPLPYVLLSKSKPNLVSAEIIEWNDNRNQFTASPGSSENSQMVVPREAAAQAMRNPRRELQCHRECHLTLSLAASKSLDSLQSSICVCFHLPRRCCLDQSEEPDSARPQQSNKLPKGKPKNETVPAVPVISCPRCLTCSSQGKAMHVRNSLGAPNKGKLEACASGPNWATGGALVSKKSGSLANWLGKKWFSVLCTVWVHVHV